MPIGNTVDCPYCHRYVHLPFSASNSLEISRTENEDGRVNDYVCSEDCPVCRKPVVVRITREIKNINGHEGPDVIHMEPVVQEILYPRVSIRVKLPPEVPEEIRQDFVEASNVLPVSPKASAALSRRLLQRVLRDRFSIKSGDLFGEIKQFLEQFTPPAFLKDQLDAVRLIGNFAAHPTPDKEAAGQIIDVDPYEADWLIDTLSTLFDFAYVQPARYEERKKALNEKLKAAGKQELK